MLPIARHSGRRLKELLARAQGPPQHPDTAPFAIASRVGRLKPRLERPQGPFGLAELAGGFTFTPGFRCAVPRSARGSAETALVLLAARFSSPSVPGRH